MTKKAGLVSPARTYYWLFTTLDMISELYFLNFDAICVWLSP